MLLVEWYWLTPVVLDKGPLNGCVCVSVCLLIGLSVCYSIQSLYQHVDAQGMYYMGPGYPMERGHFWGEEDILGHAHG